MRAVFLLVAALVLSASVAEARDFCPTTKCASHCSVMSGPSGCQCKCDSIHNVMRFFQQGGGLLLVDARDCKPMCYNVRHCVDDSAPPTREGGGRRRTICYTEQICQDMCRY